jgi:hypothetical protein
MSRQVRAIEDHSVCDVCGRTILKGERPEHYLAPSRERKLVCELCAQRAQREGWIRETAAPSMPAAPPRQGERGGLLRRARRRLAAQAERGPQDGALGTPGPPPSATEVAARDGLLDRRAPGRRFGRAEGHVRAVPTSAQLKIERAVALFNESEHPRTVAGVARTLGEPRVSAATSKHASAEVLVTIAWELSWYQFVVDLAASDEPVRMEAQGQELDELQEQFTDWNARLAADGSISLGEPVAANGELEEEFL